MSPAIQRGTYPLNWREIAERVKEEARWSCVRCEHPHDPAAGRTLTVHHFDGDKCNCERWNLMPLCQACHLSVQSRVDPKNPLMFSPNAWAVPYILTGTVAGAWICERYFDVEIPVQVWAKAHDDHRPLRNAVDHLVVKIIDMYQRECKRPWPVWAATTASLRVPTLSESVKERYDHDREDERRREEEGREDRARDAGGDDARIAEG